MFAKPFPGLESVLCGITGQRPHGAAFDSLRCSPLLWSILGRLAAVSEGTRRMKTESLPMASGIQQEEGMPEAETAQSCG